MEEKKNSSPSISRIFLLIIVPLVLLLSKMKTLVSIYVILVVLILVYEKRLIIKAKFITLHNEWMKLKKLDYYHITDDDKNNDIEKRKNALSLLQGIIGVPMFIFVFIFPAVHYLAQKIFGESIILILLDSVFRIVFLSLVFGFIFAGIIRIIYKYTTVVYVLVPIAGFYIFLFTYKYIPPAFTSLNLIVYFAIVWILYWIWSMVCPVHILRQLNSRTVLFSSIFTIFLAILSQVFPEVFMRRFSDSNNTTLNIEDIKNSTEISDDLKSLILENDRFIEVVHYFYERDALSRIHSFTTMLVTALTVSFVLGGLVVVIKINKYKKEAKKLYRSFIKDNSIIDYPALIRCAAYGGEEYENLILNHPLMSGLVLKEEFGCDIPNTGKNQIY